MDEDYGYDEGSDRDNWEDEQVFQDHEGEEYLDADDAEALFADEYEVVFGTRPEFSVSYLSNAELLARIENLHAARCHRQFVFA